MRILLGLGGGDDSLTALERTAERAVEAGDDLTIALIDDGERSIEELEAEIDRTLEGWDLDAERRYLGAEPGSELVDIAESEGFDRIVIGGGTTSPMGKIQIGNTAEFVLLNSHVSVTLVR